MDAPFQRIWHSSPPSGAVATTRAAGGIAGPPVGGTAGATVDGTAGATKIRLLS